MARWFFFILLLVAAGAVSLSWSDASELDAAAVPAAPADEQPADEATDEPDEADDESDSADDEEADEEEADESDEDEAEAEDEADADEASDEKDDESADAKSDEEEAEDSEEKSTEKEKAADEEEEESSDEKKEKEAVTKKSDADKPKASKKDSAEKGDDKKADAADEKAEKAEDKPAEEKKPETHKVAKKDLKIEVEVEGVFVAEETEEVALRPEVWSTFKVLEAVPHGKRVRKGDELVKFDPKEFDEALEEKSLQMRLGELALMAAEEEFPRLEKSIELAYESAEREKKETSDEYERFQKTMRRLSEKLAEYYLKSAEQDLANAREELDQLQQMYEADELTEETEEIVLKRQKFQVQAAEFFMEYSKINHDYTMNVSIPRREEMLSTAVEESELTYERAKMAKSLGLNKERYELQALRETRQRSVENHAKLLADRALMTLKAPADGIAYFGRAINGRWVEVSSMESKLVPFGNVSPNSVVYTIVKDRPMFVETSIGEKELPTVKAGQEAIVSPVSDSEVEIEGKVEKMADVPGSGNKFALQLEIGSEKAPDWLMPGMSAKAKITTYEVEDAVVIPAELVQADEDEPKKKYVMLQVEDEEKPVRREIKLGKTKDKDVEVLKGLKEGDLILKGAKDEPAKEEGDETKDKEAEKAEKKE